MDPSWCHFVPQTEFSSQQVEDMDCEEKFKIIRVSYLYFILVNAERYFVVRASCSNSIWFGVSR